jgi:hypothetical protein
MPDSVFQSNAGGSSHILYQSDIQNHLITLPIIVTNQNGKQYFTTSMENFDVMRFSDIPALDGSLNAVEEAVYTDQSTAQVAAGLVPGKWQRPSNRRRIDGANGIGAWLDGDQNNTMPDGILLGLNQNLNDNLVVSEDFQLIGGRTIRQVEISQQLLDSCPIHGPFLLNGNQVYQNRCFEPDCQHHLTTTAPLIIIDGQHRTLGLSKSGIESKQVTVSLLPILPIDAHKSGYNQQFQAKIFEQVNSQGKDLSPNHLLWLKRMFGTWAPTPAPANARGRAYDLITKLGHTANMLPIPSPWVGKILLLNASSAGCLVTNPVFSVGEGTGKINGTGPFESVMTSLNAASALSGSSIQSIASYWLDTWSLRVAPARFAAGGLFDSSSRSFAALVRTMHITLQKMMLGGVVAFTNVEFDAELMPYSPHFASANWDRFADSGDESVQLNVFNVLSKIVESAPGTLGPTWSTFSAAPNWEDWILDAPDPLERFFPPTNLVSGQADGITPDLDSGNVRAPVTVASILEWDSPWNIGYAVSAQWRLVGGPWKRLQNFGRKVSPGGVCGLNRTCEFDLGDAGNLTGTLVPGVGDWDLRIVYDNTIGTSSAFVLGFTA